MIFFKYFISLFLMLSLYTYQVNAILNITAETFTLSHQIMMEIERKSAYVDKKDVIDKLKGISEMFCAFITKYKDIGENMKNNLSNDLFDKSAPDSLVNMLSNFHEGPWGHSVTGYLSNHFCLRVKLALNSESQDRALTRTYDDEHSIEIAVRENDYHLHGEDTYKDALRRLHKLLVKVDEESGQSFISFLTNKTQAIKCNQKQSIQRLFLQRIEETILIIDTIAYATMQFSYAQLKVLLDAYHLINENMKERIEIEIALWEEKDMIKKMKEAERQFMIRNLETLKTLKSTMAILSRNIWNCSVEREVENSGDDVPTKIQLRVFQNYIVNEANLNHDGSCTKDCPHYQQSKIHRCFDKEICTRQRPCEGSLRNCFLKTESTIKICPSDENIEKRYEFIDIEGKRYGKNKKEECRFYITEATYWRRGFFKCSYCMCTCENEFVSIDRYFNLRPITSNTELNYVVTGMRFQKQNEIIHIQIEQGQLLKNGVINSTTLEWRPLDNYGILDENIFPGIDYYAISWQHKTLCLDELDSPNDSHVLTGLRFKSVFEGNNYIKLEIRLTPFNFNTGELSDAKSYWFSNDANLMNRKELNFDKYKVTKLKSDQYLRFTVSPLELDAGQSTIPHIDTQEVQSIPAVPLSGAGLFLAKGYSLALKGLTYDLVSHI